MKELTEEVRKYPLKPISEIGSQATLTKFMAKLSILGIEQIFCTYDNPRGMRRLSG